MSERNFRSYYPHDGNISSIALDPIGERWTPGSWSDTAHFSGCTNQAFRDWQIILGGNEDCVDLNNVCVRNSFEQFSMKSGGKYCITLKGGSCDNLFSGLYIKQHGNVVDIEIGNWSDQSMADNTNNHFWGVQSEDGKPVTYAYRYGSKPVFTASNVKHLWPRSAVITTYWYAKYIWTHIKP
jgi:hypothetical protein